MVRCGAPRDAGGIRGSEGWPSLATVRAASLPSACPQGITATPGFEKHCPQESRRNEKHDSKQAMICIATVLLLALALAGTSVQAAWVSPVSGPPCHRPLTMRPLQARTESPSRAQRYDDARRKLRGLPGGGLLVSSSGVFSDDSAPDTRLQRVRRDRWPRIVRVLLRRPTRPVPPLHLLRPGSVRCPRRGVLHRDDEMQLRDRRLLRRALRHLRR
ncbi:hypothetical protein DFJ74DRAFT_688438 [Hyaloraphidium curvatum]|nr:hypothetical protein DFJ74DRAFT_688438 [Hyaloraphidium curvatum]